MENKKLVIPAPVGVDGDDVTTWALPEGATARFDRGWLDSMAFSPDGHYLAVATKIGLWWYEVATMSPVAFWETERGVVCNLAFSPNGKWIATRGWDEVLKVWDVQRGVSITEIALVDIWDPFTFSPDNRWLAIGDHNTANIELWEPETGKIVSTLVGETEKGGRFMPIAFSPDMQLLASTNSDHAAEYTKFIIVWDLKSGERVARLTGHIDYVYHLCFSPCGRFLTSGGEEDGTVLTWDVRRWQQIKSYTADDEARMIPSYSPEGILRAASQVCNDDHVTVWDLENNEKLYTVDFGGPVTFSDGSRLAYKYDEFLEVWTLDNPTPRRTVQTHSSLRDTSESLVFSQDGKTIAATYSSDNIVLWDIASKAPRSAIAVEVPEDDQSLHVSLQGEFYRTSINKNTVKLWKVEDRESLIAEFTRNEPVLSMALTLTNNKLASAHKDGSLIISDLQSGDKCCAFMHPLKTSSDDIFEAAQLTFEPDEVLKLVFSPNGRLLMSDTKYGPNTRLWDLERGEEIQEFPSDEIKNTGAFSPCSEYFVGISGDRENIILWDIKQHETITTFSLWDIKQGETLMPFSFQRVFPFAYSPCGSYLACGGLGVEGIPLWDLKRREIYKRLSVPKGCKGVYSLAFSSCGQYLAFGAFGYAWEAGFGTVPICLWEVETGKRIITLSGHFMHVHSLAFSPNNEFLASASYDGSILLWDLKPYL